MTIILPEMRRRGHQVSLLTGSNESSRTRYSYEGVQINRSPLLDLNWLYDRGLDGLEQDIRRYFSRHLDEIRPEVIHAHNFHYFSRPHAYILTAEARKRNIPVILTAHNVWDDSLFLELTHDILWDHIIAVSHFIKREFIGVGIDDRRIRVIHHGVDQTRFNRPADGILIQYPRLKDRKIVFHPARMGLAKGCDVSIKAVNLLKERYPDIILILAGSKNIIDWGATQQKDIAYMVNLIKYFGMEDNCLIDFFPLETMYLLYSICDICVYPSSVSEPFGLAMLEAMASAKPIIVTKVGGMSEIISNGINGYLIPAHDCEALAEKIRLLLEDGRLRRRLGYTGQRMIEAMYTRERVAEENIELYRETISRIKREGNRGKTGKGELRHERTAGIKSGGVEALGSRLAA